MGPPLVGVGQGVGPLQKKAPFFLGYPPRYINWAAPTIDIFKLFMDYPPMNIYQLGRFDG